MTRAGDEALDRIFMAWLGGWKLASCAVVFWLALSFIIDVLRHYFTGTADFACVFSWVVPLSLLLPLLFVALIVNMSDWKLWRG